MAFGWDDALVVGSSLASTLGGGNAQREAARLRNQEENYLKRQQGVLGDITNLRDQSRAGLDRFGGQALDATQDYADFLRQDPWTGEAKDAYLAEALQGIDRDYATGITNSVAQNALAGTPQSSRTMGDIQGLTNSRNATVGNARIGLANQRRQGREGRLAQLAAVLNGQRSQLLNETQGDNQSLYGGWGNLADSYGGLAGNAQGRADTAGAGQAGLYGGLASFLPGLLNGNKTEATKPVPSLYGVTPFNPTGSTPGWEDDLMQRQRALVQRQGQSFLGSAS